VVAKHARKIEDPCNLLRDSRETCSGNISEHSCDQKAAKRSAPTLPTSSVI